MPLCGDTRGIGDQRIGRRGSGDRATEIGDQTTGVLGISRQGFWGSVADGVKAERDELGDECVDSETIRGFL